MVRCERLFAVYAASLIALATGNEYEHASLIASSSEASSSSKVGRSWDPAIVPLVKEKSQRGRQEESHVGVFDLRTYKGQETVFNKLTTVGLLSKAEGTLIDDISKPEDSFDAGRAAGVPVTGTVNFYTAFDPLVRAGQDFGATMQVTGRSGSLLGSFNAVLYFAFVRLDDAGNVLSAHKAKGPVFSGSTSVLASNGWASVSNWRIFKTGTYQIKAMCDGCAPALSPPVRVVSGEPFSLRLLQQPADSRSGQSLSVDPVVEATDAFGNAVFDLDGEVFVSLVPRTMSGLRERERNIPVAVFPRCDTPALPVLLLVALCDLTSFYGVRKVRRCATGSFDRQKMMMGTLTRSFTDGRAKFSGLAIGAAGIGYRLHFSLISPVAARAVEAFSRPFNVEAGDPAELKFVQQPPDEITTGSFFTVEVRLIDSYGNAATGPHIIELSAWDDTASLPLLGTTTAETNADSGLATFREVAFQSGKGEFFVQAACMTCETSAVGHSSRISVRTSSYILVTSCTLLREGSADGKDECVVTIALHSLSQKWPRESVLIRIAEVEPVTLHGGSGEIPLKIVPESLLFNSMEGPYSGEFIIKIAVTNGALIWQVAPDCHEPEFDVIARCLSKATDDTRLRYSTDSSDVQSGLFIQHYRVHLQVESLDMFWNKDAVEFIDKKFITVRVVDDDTSALVFSSLDKGPIVLRRGDSISYGVSLGFSPTSSVEVALESAVGVTVEPKILEFNEANWAVPQPVTLNVTKYFPAAPFVAPQSLPWSLTVSKLSVGHQVKGDQSFVGDVGREELIFLVVEESSPLASNTEALWVHPSFHKFNTVLTPVEAVSVRLECNGFFDPSTQVITLTPQQWRKGATFRLRALDDGESSKPSTLRTCAVTLTSGDQRFNFSIEDFANPADQSFGGYRVEVLVYKQYCADGDYRSNCPCLPGQQCGGSRQMNCPAGMYRLPGTTACLQCPDKHFCLEGSIRPQPCPDGSTAAAGSATCRLCAEHECISGHGLGCPAGRYSNAGTCVDCPEGFFCPAEGLTTPQRCPPGTYSSQASVTCTECPSGSFCPTGKFADMQRCPSGTYSGVGSTVCSPCPAGYQCSTSVHANLLMPCGPGEYSEEGTSHCLACPRNFACPTPLEKVACDPVTQFAPPGQQVCRPCPNGFSCESGEPVACPLGFDSFEGVGQCVKAEPPPTTVFGLQLREIQPARADPECPEGRYYQGTGCFPWGPHGQCGHTDCLPRCPRGYYCPAGAVTPRIIDEGFYSIETGLETVNEAIKCPRGAVCAAGSFVYQLCEPDEICPGYGAGKAKCPPGTVFLTAKVVHDQSACMTCPAAHYCPNAYEPPIPCPLGTYSKTDGAASEDACILFPPGACACAMLLIRSPELFPTGWGGKKIPCSVGYFSRVQLGTSALHCEPCPARMMCDNETHEVLVCPKGHFCPTGTAVGKQRPCLPGTYSPATSLADSGECISCQPGYYCPQGSSSQIKCPKGSYCPKRTASPSHYPCPGGTYNNEEMAIDIVQCLPCPTGMYCPEGTVRPLSCPEGTYSDGYGTKLPGPGSHRTMCMFCPSGYSCSGGRRKACGKGKTSKEGDGKCISCPQGYYCPLDVTTYDMLEQFSCPAGVLCSTGGLQSVDGGQPCPAGHYCPQGVSKAIKCPAGTYNPLRRRTTLSDCITSKAGTYAEEGTTTAEGTGDCQQGHFCPAGSSVPTQVACPAQTYNPSRGGKSSSDCLPCPAGSYCGSATIQPQPCPAGHYCPIESSEARPCPAGTFRESTGAAAEQECTLCSPGHYCATSGLTKPTGKCAAGTLCLEGASNAAPRDGLTGIICPAYGYCPTGATSLQACQEGYFNPYEGGTSEADCRKCFPGYYCSLQDGAPVVGKCDPGYTCPLGSSSPTQEIAPVGSFAPEGSAIAQFCPPGTYAPNEGSASCKLCPAGAYCDEAGMGTEGTKDPKGCRKGMYCPEGSIFHLLCPPGTYNPRFFGQSIDDCLPCSPGKYCQFEELEEPSGECAAGYYCARRSISIAPIEMDSFGNGPCPAGSYCPQGTETPQPCPPGTYQPSTHASELADCLECPAGWYCEHEGLKAPGAKCPAGYFCEEGTEVAEVPDRLCPLGHMCPPGSAVAIPCLPGTYQDLTGRASCNVCGAGYFCLTGAQDGFAKERQCPGGSFCPTGTKSGKEFLCPPGFYNSKRGMTSVLSCLPCSPGHYCGQAGLKAPSEKCAAGFYCTTGARYPNEVLEGCVYDSGVPGRGLGNCSGASDFLTDKSEAEKLCSSIAECVGIEEDEESSYHLVCGNVDAPEEGTRSIFFPKLCVKAGLCPVGKICPAGTSTPQECPPGKFCASKGLVEPSGDCHEGFFCGGGATEPAKLENACRPGYYCPQGTREMLPCPQGTFLSASGAWEQEQCQPCPPGRFCALSGLAAPSGVCSIGFFCTSKSTSPGDPQSICPEGNYCPEGTGDPVPCDGGTYQSQKGEGSCKTCPEGSYCPSGSSAPRPCPVGFYCPPGTHYEFQYPCPQGTYGKTEGATAASSCAPCEGGYLCSYPGRGAQGQNAMTKCPPGYYCPEGKSITPRSCTYGEYCPEKSASPTPCPPSFYCANEALEWPTGRCRGGYLCKQRATTHSPESATSGKSCPENSEGYPCPIGHYCHGVSLVDSLAALGSKEAPPDEARKAKSPPASVFSGLTGLSFNHITEELVVADYGNTSISVFSLSTGELTQIYDAGRPAGLEVSDDGNTLYASFPDAGQVLAISLQDRTIKKTIASNLRKPWGLCLSLDGKKLFVAEAEGSKVSIIDLEKSTAKALEIEGRVVQLESPRDIAISPDGDLYIVQSGTFKVRTVQFELSFTSYQQVIPMWRQAIGRRPDSSHFLSATRNRVLCCKRGFGWKHVSYSTHLCVHPIRSQLVRVSETEVEPVKILPPLLRTMKDKGLDYQLGEITSVAYGQLSSPTLFLADAQKHVVWKLDLETSQMEQILGTGTAGFSGDGRIIPAPEALVDRPLALALGEQLGTSTKRLFVLDSGNKRIRKVFISPVERGEILMETPCPDGTFSNSEGGSTEEDCILCPAGYACQGQGQAHISARCSDGYYCPEGSSSVTAVPCPPGHFCKAEGVFTNVAHGAEVETLDAADFVNGNLPEFVADGDTGFESAWISKSNTSGHTIMLDFGDLYFIRDVKIISGTQQGDNILSNFIVHYLHGASDSYLELVAVYDNNQPEHVSSFGEVSTRRIMLTTTDRQVFISEISVEGTSSPGPAAPTPCPRGSYQELQAQAACKMCPEGFYCSDSSVAPASKCPAGHYCPKGTYNKSQHPCPLGTYRDTEGAKSSSECMACPAGQYCGSRGLTAPSGNCFALAQCTFFGGQLMTQGFYCEGRAWLPAPSEFERNPDGDFSPSGRLCPSGYYCLEGTKSPASCPDGTSSSAPGSKRDSDCLPCLPGNYCSNSIGTGLCAEGFYCLAGSSVPNPSGSNGSSCPGGHYCPEGSYTPQPCPPGTFSEGGRGDCTPCTLGWYCPQSQLESPKSLCKAGHACPKGAVYPIPCPPGTLAAGQGSSACELCSGGFVCDEAGLATPSGACPGGFVCVRGARTDTLPLYVFGDGHTDFGLCPAGHYCPANTLSPTPCSPGTYQDGVGALECKLCSPGFACTEYGLTSPNLPCEAGFYCIKGSAALRPTDGLTGDRCPAGWHCPAGSFAPQACPPGEYTTGPGQATCKTCPAGYECALSSSVPSPCSDGLVCPEGSMRGFRCPLGSYKKNSESSTPEEGCVPCPRGKYCRAGIIAGPCAAGFLCALGNSVPNPNYAEFPRSPYFPAGIEGSASAIWLTETNWKTSLAKSYGGIPCPAGYYCAEGEVEPSTCSRGTFRLEKGGRWPSDCSVCPPGYYCLPTTAEPALCPKGHYCSRGTQTPSPCPKRYYNPLGRQSSRSSCILCPAGMACATEGISELGDEHICPAGHYCTQGSSTAIPCPAGTYNPQKGSVSSSACQPCPGGIFCGSTGTSSLSIRCPRGYYCPASSKGALPCEPGSYCPEGSPMPSRCPGGKLCPAMSAEPQACPRGFYCPEGMAFALACPAGARMNPYDFLRDSESSACETCPAGTYSSIQGSADCTPCEAGYICEEGCNAMFPQSIASNSGMPCQPGHYCPKGSSIMTPCPAGTYNPSSAKTSIDDCRKCPLGSYTVSMGQSSCIACGGSTYTEAGSFECKCSGANRVYQASSGACVCRKGYERIVAGLDVSHEDSAEPCYPKVCSRTSEKILMCGFSNGAVECFKPLAGACNFCASQIYLACGGSKVLSHTGACRDKTSICEDMCGPKGGTYLPERALCACTGVLSSDEVCDEGCREQQRSFFLQDELLVLKNAKAGILTNFALETLRGRSDVLFGTLGCSKSICPALMLGLSQDERIHGYFGVPDDLLAAMDERLAMPGHEGLHYKREYANSLTSSYASESLLRNELVSVQSPVLCILVGSTVLWELEPGEKPLYPIYLSDSVINTIDNFDADSFRELQIEMESGAPLLLFGHTFTASGIAVFSVNTNVNSIAVVNVVDDEKHCGSMSLNTPHPLEGKILEALPIAISDLSFFGSPSWTAPCIIFGFVMLFIAAVIVLQSIVRNRYWTFAPPPRVEEDDEAIEELRLSQNSKAQQSILCCKGAIEEEPDLEDTLNDLDPRIFQAVYWKLLDSMAMVKDQLEHLRMNQDKLIELGIDIAAPLKASILPTLSEASEKKSRAEAEDAELSKRLLDFKNLMLLRKGALEEAVQKASEALKKETVRFEKFRDLQNDDESYVSKWSSGGAFEELQKTTQQASRALVQVATLNPQAFATVLGVEQSIATADALKRLQTADAAAQTMRELIAETSHTKDQQGLLSIINSRMKQKLDASDLWTEGSDALKTQEELISDQRNLYEARRSMCSMLAGLLHQRNEILMQQQIVRDELVVQEIGEMSGAVAALLEALYERFVSSRRDVDKAISNRQQPSLPSLQKQFEEAVEDIYNGFTKKQQEVESKRQEQARERSSEFAKVVQDFVMQCRKSLDQAERDIFNAEELIGSKRESLEVQILEAYHTALLRAREDQLAYLHSLQRKLVAEKARNDCLARMHLETGSTQGLSEEYKADTDQQLKALDAEQEAALADLKAAMDRERIRTMRIHKAQARIIEGFGQDERKKSSIWHETRFRLLTDEFPCFINGQTRLEEARAHQLRRLRQRLVLEAEEFLTKLKVILKMPGSVHATGELQQCLDVCNRKIRSASESAARALTSLHKTVINSVIQEVRIARSSLIRAMELEEEELAQRSPALKAQQQEVNEENESFHLSFCTTVAEEDLEVDHELRLVKEKLAMERIRLQFIEDERDSFSSRVSEIKAAASGEDNKKALQEVVKDLKAESSARFKELEAHLDEQVKRRARELEDEQEERRKLALERIAAAVEAQEKCTEWVGRQYSEITEIAKRQQRQVLQLTFQISDQLFSSLLGVTVDANSSGALQGGDEALNGLSQRGLYFFALLSLLPMMASPSVPPPERHKLLNNFAKKREHTVKAINQERAKLLGSRLREAKARQDRLSSAEDLMRDNLAIARGNEWMTTLLENAAIVADSLVLAGTAGPVGWARSYCDSVEEVIEKHLRELEEKQAAELAAFEADAKEEMEKGELEIRNLQDKVNHILDASGDAAQKAKEREERRVQLLEAQKKERLNEELQKQREFLEAQWRISRTVEFEALRSSQGDSVGVTEAEKELLVKCQEAELRDLKELLNRQRLLILNTQRHESQKEAERRFHLAEALLGDLSVLDGAPQGPWSEEVLAAARRQVSQEEFVEQALVVRGAELAIEEDNQIAELKARHYSQLAEMVQAEAHQETATIKTVQLQLPSGKEKERESASKSKSHSTDAPELSASKQVAEWQERLRSGSRASVFVPSSEQSGDQSKAFLKQLEKFAKVIAKTQREERDRQHLIMQEKLEKRTERQLAAGKLKKRNTVTKKKKSIAPRKSIVDMKFARIQAEKQKEQQMRAKFKAEKNALEKWHPLFWNIIEEEANNGSYDDYEGTQKIVARGPILRSIERIISSLEEGSFLRTMAANLELLGQACVSLGAAAGDAVLESERSEIDHSSDASTGDDEDESKLQPAKSATAQRRRASKESDSSSSEETESSEEEEERSSEEESDSDVESSDKERFQEGKASTIRTSMKQAPETRAAAAGADQTPMKQQHLTEKEQASRSSSDSSSSSGRLSSRSAESPDQSKSSSSGQSSVSSSEGDKDSSSSSESSDSPGGKASKTRPPPTGLGQESSLSSSSSSSGSSISSSSSLSSSASLSAPTSQQTQERPPQRQPSSSSSSSSGIDEGQGGEQPSKGGSGRNSEDDSSSSGSSSSSIVSEGTD